MSEALEYLRDRWEWDSTWRDQIVLTVIIGTIGLLFAYLEARVGAVAS